MRRRRLLLGAASGGGPTIGPWVAGTDTTLSETVDRARATSTGGNARISREVSGLVEGATYRLVTNAYASPGVPTVFVRVDTEPNLGSGSYLYQSGGEEAINGTFVAPVGGLVYIGIVGVTTLGQYAETNLNFTLTQE